MPNCSVCRRPILEGAEAAQAANRCACANPVPELRPLTSGRETAPAARRGRVEWGNVGESWSLGNSHLTGRSRQLGENEELKPLGQAAPPAAPRETTESCPYCGVQVKSSRLGWHIENRCLEAPHTGSATRQLTAVPAAAAPALRPTTGAEPDAPPIASVPGEWLNESTYTIVIHSRDVPGAGAMVGLFVWSGVAAGVYAGLAAPVDGGAGEEAECRALLLALEQMAARLEATGEQPDAVSLMIYSRRQALLQLLEGEHKAKSALLQPLVAQARETLGRFAQVGYSWKPSREIDKLFGK